MGASSSEVKSPPPPPPPPPPPSPPPSPMPEPQLLSKPWRGNDNWSQEYYEKLIQEVAGACSVEDPPGAMLLGRVMAGKSSFINSVLSIDKDTIVSRAIAGCVDKSFTKQFRKFRGRKKLKNFRLWDVMGFEFNRGKGFNTNDLLTLIEGHVLDNYTFNPETPLPVGDANYKEDVEERDKCHCVLFVVDCAHMSGSADGELKTKLAEIHTAIYNKYTRMPRVLILTKADAACKQVAEDVRNIFKSIKIRDAVKTASELFGIPMSNIHPVKNFEGEIEVDPFVSIPILLALRQIVNIASDYREPDDY